MLCVLLPLYCESVFIFIWVFSFSANIITFHTESVDDDRQRRSPLFSTLSLCLCAAFTFLLTGNTNTIWGKYYLAFDMYVERRRSIDFERHFVLVVRLVKLNENVVTYLCIRPSQFKVDPNMKSLARLFCWLCATKPVYSMQNAPFAEWMYRNQRWWEALPILKHVFHHLFGRLLISLFRHHKRKWDRTERKIQLNNYWLQLYLIYVRPSKGECSIDTFNSSRIRLRTN